MNFISGDHLRVTSIQTEDGTRPKYDENGQQMYKETLLPLTAKKHMEKRNELLPNHLKMKIEVVRSIQDGPGATPLQKAEVATPSSTAKRFTTAEAKN